MARQVSMIPPVLSNPIHRGFYDMLVGVRPQTDKEVLRACPLLCLGCLTALKIARLNGMKRDQARKELSCMEKTVTSIETEEEAREGLSLPLFSESSLPTTNAGLVIADAHYGDLRSQGKAGVSSQCVCLSTQRYPVQPKSMSEFPFSAWLTTPP